MPVLGIDVYRGNGVIAWGAVARSEMRFAYCKATEGSTYVDSQFRRNWELIRDVGLLRGAYHFARPGTDPEAQASFFAATIGEPSWGELPPVLDLEVTDGHQPAYVIDWTLRFVRRAEQLLGRQVMIYTGGLWRRQIGNPDHAELGQRLLWTARYGTQEPVLPRSWKRWDFWQFTDGVAGEVVQVSGVSGPCDVNRFRGEQEELEHLIDRVPLPVPSPPPPGGHDDSWPGRYFLWPAQPLIQGEDVRRWQERMHGRGFLLDVDGVYGIQSRHACMSLQRQLGLMPDGIVGRQTWDATFDTDPDSLEM